MRPIEIKRLMWGLAFVVTGMAGAAERVTIKGSDTMVILGQQWAERYMKTHPDAVIQVTGGGSGTGIAALINGATDIAQSSRPMKPKERDEIKKRQGKEVKEISVALDGIAIYVHPSNGVKDLSLEQLKSIYTHDLMDWKDVGGAPGAIVMYGRENNSGTYAYFKEHVLKEVDFAPEVQTLPGTAAVINAVSKDPKSIGYGGIAYSKGVKALGVRKDAGSTPLKPSMSDVVAGRYPISRSLYFYVKGEPTGSVKEFIDWILSVEGQKICEKVGYYPLPNIKTSKKGR